jgi:acyl-CoA thioesterase
VTDDGATGAFAEQLASIEPDPDGVAGRYRVDVDKHWNCPIVPHGGVMASIAARAMELEVGDPAQTLRTLTTVFAAQVPAGPVTIDVGVLRRGRSASQATATLRAEGDEAGHTTLAVFGRPRVGFALTDSRRPEVPPPDQCPSFRDEPEDDPRDDVPPFEVPFWDHVEGRPAMGHAPWDEWVPDRSDVAHWYRFDEPPRRPDGTLDPLALVTLCDTMPSSMGERMGPGGPRWWAPSADLTVHLLGESRSEWVLAHLRAHRASEGYGSGEMALWDPEGGLVAFATQVMFFRYDEPPGPEFLVPLDERPT